MLLYYPVIPTIPFSKHGVTYHIIPVSPELWRVVEVIGFEWLAYQTDFVSRDKSGDNVLIDNLIQIVVE
jgi:hypothetical protein